MPGGCLPLRGAGGAAESAECPADQSTAGRIGQAVGLVRYCKGGTDHSEGSRAGGLPAGVGIAGGGIGGQGRASGGLGPTLPSGAGGAVGAGRVRRDRGADDVRDGGRRGASGAAGGAAVGVRFVMAWCLQRQLPHPPEPLVLVGSRGELAPFDCSAATHRIRVELRIRATRTRCVATGPTSPNALTELHR